MLCVTIRLASSCGTPEDAGEGRALRRVAAAEPVWPPIAIQESSRGAAVDTGSAAQGTTAICAFPL